MSRGVKIKRELMSRITVLLFAISNFCKLVDFAMLKKKTFVDKGLFTWSRGPRSRGISFFCFHARGDTKQKKLTPLDRGPPLHVNRV